jgi:hypothetical protein
MQWCVCRLEAWFAADADEISLKNWDQVSTHHLTPLRFYLHKKEDPLVIFILYLSLNYRPMCRNMFLLVAMV